MVNSFPISLFGIHPSHFLGFTFSRTYADNRIRSKPPPPPTPLYFWRIVLSRFCSLPSGFEVIPLQRELNESSIQLNSLPSNFMAATSQINIYNECCWKGETNSDCG